MAETLEQLIVDINADTKGFEKGLDSVQKGTDTFGKGLKKIGGLLAGAFAAKQVIEFGKVTVDAANAQIAAETRLETITKTVTQATDEQIQVLKDLASAQQQVGVIGDEVTIAGQSQLASFGLQTESIGELTAGFQDLLVAQFGTNTSQEQAIQTANLLGKAFSGQVGALTRVGILLNDAQGEILKTGTESEKTAALVEILNQNYGGLNKAIAETPEGKATQLKNEWGDFQEEIGFRVLPIVESLVSFLSDVLPGAIDILFGSLDSLINIITNVGNQFGIFTNSLNINFNTIFKGFELFITRTKSILIEYFLFFQEIFINIFTVVFNIFSDISTFVLEFVNNNKETIMTFLETARELFSTTLELIKTLVSAALETIQEFWDTWGQDILEILGFIFKEVVTIFQNVFNILNDIFNIFVDLFTGNWSKLWEDVKSLFSNIIDVIVDLFKLGLEGVQLILGDIIKAISETLKNAVQGIIDFGKAFFDAGKELMNGLKNGIISAGKAVANAAINAARAAVDGVKDFLGIKSPSRLMMGVGDNFSEGMAKGIINNKSPMRAIESLNNMVNSAIEPLKNDSGSVNNGNGLNGTQTSRIPISKEPIINIFNNNNPNPSDIARQIKKQEQAFALNFG